MKAMMNKYKKLDRGPPESHEMERSAKRQRQTLNEAYERNNVASISFHCREGSVTHYYHFFFGAFIPLIEYHLLNPYKSLRIITDVGPFKRLLCELPITIIEILGPDFGRGIVHDDKSISRVREPEEVALKGYDTFNSEYYFEDFFPKPSRITTQKILDFFHNAVPCYIKLLPTYDILLIQRAQDKYYSNGCRDRTAVYQTSGSERRSITNHEELASALTTKYGSGFSNIVLEQSSIFYQYHMFSNARVVIAQHGASLANIFFMTQTGEGTSSPPRHVIVEISPPWSREFAHFRNLADYCSVGHTSIEQAQDHSDVDIGRVMTAVENALQQMQHDQRSEASHCELQGVGETSNSCNDHTTVITDSG